MDQAVSLQHNSPTTTRINLRYRFRAKWKHRRCCVNHIRRGERTLSPSTDNDYFKITTTATSNIMYNLVWAIRRGFWSDRIKQFRYTDRFFCGNNGSRNHHAEQPGRRHLLHQGLRFSGHSALPAIPSRPRPQPLLHASARMIIPPTTPPTTAPPMRPLFRSIPI